MNYAINICVRKVLQGNSQKQGNELASYQYDSKFLLALTAVLKPWYSWSTLPRGIKHLKVIKLWGRTFVHKAYNEKEAIRSRSFWLMQVLATLLTVPGCARLCSSLFQSAVWNTRSTKLAFASLLQYFRCRPRKPLNMMSAVEFSANWSPVQRMCTRWCWRTLLAIGTHALTKLTIAISGTL